MLLIPPTATPLPQPFCPCRQTHFHGPAGKRRQRRPIALGCILPRGKVGPLRSPPLEVEGCAHKSTASVVVSPPASSEGYTVDQACSRYAARSGSEGFGGNGGSPLLLYGIPVVPGKQRGRQSAHPPLSGPNAKLYMTHSPVTDRDGDHRRPPSLFPVIRTSVFGKS